MKRAMKTMANAPIIFDIEANGLLDEVSVIHCIAIGYENGTVHAYNAHRDMDNALMLLENAPMLIGHNIQGYDIPAIQKVYPSFKPKGIIRDTLVMSRLQRVHQMRQHSLAAWGELLGTKKGDYDGPWTAWSQEMEDYCIQDVRVNIAIWRELIAEEYPEQAIQLEHDFAKILDWQMEMGIKFDEQAACILAAQLIDTEKEQREKIKETIPDWEEVFIPKVNNKRYGYVKGVPIIKTTPFNPGSRSQVVRFFKERYKWNPVDFTDKNNPKVSGDILRKLPYEEAKPLADYFDTKKLLGQLIHGKGAWLKMQEEGTIHGYINHNGAVTGRCTHSSPNLAQVPRVSSFKGEECRSLFQVPQSFKLVGCDAAGLELRNLAHYMAAYDGGRYVRTVIDGDVHTENQNAAGLPTRDSAKTFIYAHNYGAGDAKLGSILHPEAVEEIQKEAGRQMRNKFMAKIPALRILVEQCKNVAKKRGYLIGLDGRKLWVRSPHRALNTLLQGAGSVIMKAATVIKWKEVIGDDLDWRTYMRTDYRAYPCLHVHDETQDAVRESFVDEFREIAERSIAEAGEMFGYKCPLEGEAKVGDTWSETH